MRSLFNRDITELPISTSYVMGILLSGSCYMLVCQTFLVIFFKFKVSKSQTHVTNHNHLFLSPTSLRCSYTRPESETGAETDSTVGFLSSDKTVYREKKKKREREKTLASVIAPTLRF